jgi:hypothetical protein
MWSDVLQQAERLHWLRLGLWGSLSTLGGTTAVTAYRGIPLRDISGATRLDRLSWLQLGLFLGLTAVGVTLAASSRGMKSREYPAIDTSLPMIGAGVAIALHGLALATLQLQLITQISR